MAERLTERALNRALLARQGLLEPFDQPVERVVEAIGAIQAQYWPAAPVALWSRLRTFVSEDLFQALGERRLVTGPLLRGTLHLASAEHHPAYAAVVEAERIAQPWRLPGGADELLAAVLEFVRGQARTRAELVGFIEDWIARHPSALSEGELARQRQFEWRPLLRWSALIRVPVGNRWGVKAPSALEAAPRVPPDWPDPAAALEQIVLRHLRAFGPAAAEDIAGWIGLKTPPVREVLAMLEPKLQRFEDEAGRALYDLPEAPRPDPETYAPARLLPWFDSVLLAYAPRHRARVLPEAYKDRLYLAANLQWLPSLLLDGQVAGSWSMRAEGKDASLSLVPFRALSKAERTQVQELAEGLLRFTHPNARALRVVDAG